VISSETPYKLVEIIMDTWPQLFWLKKLKVNKNNGSININTTTKSTTGVV